MKTVEENLKDLQVVVESTRKAVWEFESKFNARKRELEVEMTKTLTAEMGDERTVVNKLHWNAEQALRIARDESAINNAKAGLKYPEGTLLVEWTSRWVSKTKYKTGEVGRLHIVTKNTEFASNLKFPPHTGDLIVQYLKKDGSVGVKFSKFFNESWYPVDVDPNVNV